MDCVFVDRELINYKTYFKMFESAVIEASKETILKDLL
tara:strand:+ start:763 stop:876 length:114 start_codon:yes stop_codon:yes gene_type:complete